MPDLMFKHDPTHHRYEAWDGDSLAGFAEYQLTDALIVFTHTEVQADYEGKGIGSLIAKFALDDVRAEGKHEVVPSCSFIKGWIDRHRDYADLVYGAPKSTAKD